MVQVVKAVASAFFGVRSRVSHEQSARISPVQVIVTGVIGAVILVVALVLLVRFITN